VDVLTTRALNRATLARQLLLERSSLAPLDAVELRHVRYFIAVAEELNFRRAAERLHIVQPGLSQQISRMESELGLALLERTKRRVELTDAGQLFLGEARALLERYEQAVTSARQAAAGQAGSLDVGFVGPAIYSVLHSVARAYLKSFPNVNLVLHELNSAEQLDRIIAGTLDVGFVRLPVRDKRVLTMQLISEPIIIVLPEGHPEAARDVVNLAALADEPFVMVPRAREPNSTTRAGWWPTTRRAMWWCTPPTSCTPPPTTWTRVAGSGSRPTSGTSGSLIRSTGAGRSTGRRTTFSAPARVPARPRNT